MRRRQTSRRHVAGRAGGCCEYCWSQQRFSPDPFAVEHIVPQCAGGDDGPENLALSCNGCNGRKYTAVSAIDPVTGAEAPLYNPRTDTWEQHFIWSEDYSVIIGLTPTGRATVERLELNRDGVKNLRLRLILTHEHPP